MRIFTDSKSIRRFHCQDLRRRQADIDGIDDRQKRIPGFSQEALNRLRVGVIGAGGLGGQFVPAAAKKGVGQIDVYDGDDVQLSNLNRQFFAPRDVGKNKAICLTRHAAHLGYMGTRLVAVPYY